MPNIETENLRMITFTKEMMKAILDGKIERLPYHAAEEWPLPVYLHMFQYKIDRFTTYPYEEKWEGIIIHKNNKRIIGDMGFKGGPNNEGDLEIGYSIVPSYQGNGYATEMGRAMIEWGMRQEGVKRITATCDSDNLASKRVLEKLGLHHIKEDKDTIYWSL
ncbi:GNAT family N-acetyltransferase [Metabacillus malikii]|uniref:RimJ/RimL family protein N-acetyltransferase n=1 Tax=Metabacillus malikii TaxID=1504265 RepID=A0ABT9ZBX7_9BACI|nr:GNAT family N-acetyltransferase [Metabacillus malikii]MDQ0229311.1 RimJ/RimL family protein N-acetyltransferase [Metabacillus malikii]